MIGISLLMIWLFIAFFSYIKNKDILSPVKFYILYIGVYFAAVFYKEYQHEIYFAYLGFLLVGALLIVFEPSQSRSYKKTKTHEVKKSAGMKFRRLSPAIWTISVVPVLFQIYLIYYMGGIQRYINRIGLRVIEWQGMGLIVEVIKMFSLLNVIYFALLLIDEDTNKRDWIKYMIHLIITLLLGFLSGSRGGMLGNFVIIVILYNYLKKQLSVKKLLPIIIALLLVASVIGVARNGYRLTDEGFVSGLSNNSGSFMDSKHFEYGLIPLEYIFSKEISDLQYGLTFFTPITNLVPRRIWPGKPDTGGLVFTKLYTGDAWGGYSNLAPGIIGEGVINFGKPFGIIFGFMLLFYVMLFVIAIYNKTMKKITNIDINLITIFLMIFYSYTVSAVPGLVQSEWTNTVLSLVFRGVKLMSIFLVLNQLLRFRYFKPNNEKRIKYKRTKTIKWTI